MKLRPYQQKVEQEILQAWREGHKAPLLVLPTGGGKTYTFCSIVEKVVKKHICWILVHRHNLAIQTSQSLNDLDIDHGVIGAGFSESNFKKAQVAKVGSIPSRFDRLTPPKVIIIDEAHHATAGQWAKITERYPNCFFLGVTATPERLDGKMLGKDSGGFVDKLIIGPTMAELAKMGYLSKPSYFTPTNFTGDSIKIKSNGDFDAKEAGFALDKPKILNNVVARYKQICSGQPAIAFCCNVQHAVDTAEAFNNAGFRAKALVGKMGFNEQQKILGQLSISELDVVTSCEIISEGTDIPDVSTAILLRPTWSLTLYLQQVGRALRVAKDKRQKYIIDMVGNIYRHGHPFLEREWAIDGARKTPSRRKKEVDNFKIKNCSECFAVFELKDVVDNKCPECGSPITSKQRRIDIVDGDLVEVSWDEIEEELKKLRIIDEKEKEKKQKKRDYWRGIHACKTIEELVELGKKRGYKSPQFWANKIFSERIKKRSQMC